MSEPGQYYRVHHDYGVSQRKLACGPRILTFFLYLSDVEEGGETNFPRIDIKVAFSPVTAPLVSSSCIR
jgi:hypothetical protein